MPRKCCVPNCKGNYEDGPKVAVFRFPKEEAIKSTWLRELKRDEFTPNFDNVICELHFRSGEIMWKVRHTNRDTGQVLTAPLSRPKLKSTAVPSAILPNCPTYLSGSLSSRESPEIKSTRRENKAFSEAIAQSLQEYTTHIEKAHMKFPSDYPYSPPSVRFLTKVWHPNVYENGDLCISILHPPIEDPHSGELPCERWNPTQSVRTVLLSVISLLNEPNTYSPANVDASVMYRRFRDSKGKDKEYENIIRKQVMLTHSDADRDGVVVPTTLEDYCIKTKSKPDPEPVDMADFYDDDYDIDDDEDEDCDLSDNEIDDDGEDSGNGES